MPHGWKIMAGIVVLLVLYGAYQLAASADRMLNDKTVEPVPTMVKRPVAHKPIMPIMKAAETPAPVQAQSATTVLAGQTDPNATLSAAVPGQPNAVSRQPPFPRNPSSLRLRRKGRSMATPASRFALCCGHAMPRAFWCKALVAASCRTAC